jgi:hypothetical protein
MEKPRGENSWWLSTLRPSPLMDLYSREALTGVFVATSSPFSFVPLFTIVADPDLVIIE